MYAATANFNLSRFIAATRRLSWIKYRDRARRIYDSVMEISARGNYGRAFCDGGGRASEIRGWMNVGTRVLTRLRARRPSFNRSSSARRSAVWPCRIATAAAAWSPDRGCRSAARRRRPKRARCRRDRADTRTDPRPRCASRGCRCPDRCIPSTTPPSLTAWQVDRGKLSIAS